MKLILDTNVLISGLLNPQGPPGRIVDALRSGELQLIIDDRILSEYVCVLRRPYFERYFSRTDREHLIEYLTKNSEYTVATVRVSGLPDPSDAPFLETALTADVPLVTGNRKHFPSDLCKECAIYSPAEFIQLIT